MDGFKAYRYYMAVKLHFTSEKYNVFETKGHVKGTRNAFNSRNDRFIFEKLAMKYPQDKDVIQFFVSNFAYSNDTALYGNGEAEELYSEWQKRKQSITRIFIDDLTNIINYAEVNKVEFANIFNLTNGEIPVILSLWLKDKIKIETLCIINELYPFLDSWKLDPTIQIILGDKYLRVKKLSGFVKYEKDKLSKIFNHFLDELKS